MGILSHLDEFKNAKAVKKAKKRLKHRFWTEIYQGAKLFYLSGLLHGRLVYSLKFLVFSTTFRYPKVEINNLARFISVMKFRPLVWRQSHPYFVADRVEDISNPDTILRDPTSNRHVCLYGYLHGSNLKQHMKVL